MNIDEFSIACKLINLKLRGIDLPKALPPTLIASLSAVGGTPTRTPTSGMSPLDPLGGLVRPPIPPQPIIANQSIISHPVNPNQPLILTQGVQSQQQIMQPLTGVPPLIPTQPLIPGAPKPIGNSIPPLIPIQPIQPLIPAGNVPLDIGIGGVGGISGIGNVKPSIEPQKLISPTSDMILPPGHTPPHTTSNRSLSFSERAPSIDSP